MSPSIMHADANHNERLKEWRAQRKQVAAHLAWLDREIAAAEASTRPAPADATIISAPFAAAVAEELIMPPDGNVSTESDFLTPPVHTAQRQRAGCIFLAVIAGALALLLFWGLPQLLY